MKTKYLDERIKKYEDWLKNGVIKYHEKLELKELKEIKKQLTIPVVVSSANNDVKGDDDGWIYCPNCGRVKEDA